MTISARTRRYVAASPAVRRAKSTVFASERNATIRSVADPTPWPTSRGRHTPSGRGKRCEPYRATAAIGHVVVVAISNGRTCIRRPRKNTRRGTRSNPSLVDRHPLVDAFPLPPPTTDARPVANPFLYRPNDRIRYGRGAITYAARDTNIMRADRVIAASEFSLPADQTREPIDLRARPSRRLRANGGRPRSPSNDPTDDGIIRRPRGRLLIIIVSISDISESATNYRGFTVSDRIKTVIQKTAITVRARNNCEILIQCGAPPPSDTRPDANPFPYRPNDRIRYGCTITYAARDLNIMRDRSIRVRSARNMTENSTKF